MVAAAIGVAAAASTASSALSSGGGSSGANSNIASLPNAGTENQDYLYYASQLNPQSNPAVASTYGQQFNQPAYNYYAGDQGTTNDLYGTAVTDAGALQTQGVNASNTINSNASQVSPYLSAILQNGFDPQNALYAQQQQQNTDQTNASLSARGLNPSGVGAGIANQSNTNFNLDWQNNQLQRQATALGGYATGGNSAASQGEAAQNIGAAATTLPTSLWDQYLSTSQQGTTDQMSALANYLGLYQQNINNNLSYLGMSQPNSTLQNGNLANQQQSQQQQANAGSAIGQVLNSPLGQQYLNGSATDNSAIIGDSSSFLPTSGY